MRKHGLALSFFFLIYSLYLLLLVKVSAKTRL